MDDDGTSRPELPVVGPKRCKPQRDMSLFGRGAAGFTLEAVQPESAISSFFIKVTGQIMENSMTVYSFLYLWSLAFWATISRPFGKTLRSVPGAQTAFCLIQTSLAALQ